MKVSHFSVTHFRKFVSLSLQRALFGTFLLGVIMNFPAIASPKAESQVATRVIEVKTEKIGEAVHWMPENIEVKQGEKVKFVVKHELEGGFDFHGFTIAELKIAKRVDRNQTLEFETNIPADLKAGSYKITCQFHPKHMPAGFIVVQPSK